MGKKRRTKRFFRRNKIIIFLTLLLFSYLFITVTNQKIKLRELKREEAEIQAKIEELKTIRDELKQQIEESNTPQFIEKVARERLKMVKPNEFIYIIQDKESETDEE